MSKFEQLIEQLQEIGDGLEEDRHVDDAEVIDKAINILTMIEQWSNAYPESIFIPMTKEDWQIHHETLNRNADARSGSAAAADCMRYVVTQIKASLESLS